LTLHYLQSMRQYVAQAAGGEDSMRLNQEKPLSQEDQQALALASMMVSEDSQMVFQEDQPQILELVKKVQQAQQAAAQQAANADPTAQALIKTQMAETQRKAQEFQTRMQAEVQKQEQQFKLQVAELQRKVQELQAKYETQSTVDAQRNATNIATAALNNTSRERVAMINAGAQQDVLSQQLDHEQDMSALQALQAAEQDIRQHGIRTEQAVMKEQADMVRSAIETERQAALADQQHQQAMVQQATPQPQPQPPTGEI
jgi:hypothetical protein